MNKPIKYRYRKLIVVFRQKKWVSNTISFLKKLVIPGFQKIPFWEVMRFFIESIFKGILFQRAAAMTYNIFTSAIPLMMALIATMSFFSPSLQANLIDLIHSIVPDYSWTLVSKIISDLISRQNNTIFWLSLFLGIYLTFISFNSIINSLNITYFNIKKRNVIQQLPVSLVLVLVFFVIVVLACAIFVYTSHFITMINEKFIDSQMFYTIAIIIARWILVFILIYLFLSALFYIAPYDKKYFKFFSAGSMFSTISLVFLMYAINLYFSYFSTYNVVYGSMGALLVILLCIYWSSTVILVGFDLNVSICIAQQKRKCEADEIVLESTINT